MKNLNLMRVIILVIILSNLGINSKSQINPNRTAKSIFITGIVFDSKTLEPLPSASFNINNKNSFATNETGRFSFYGFPSDTLVFTYLGYKPTVLVVPDTLKSEEYVLGVFMREQAVKLAEVIILRRVNTSSIIITPVQTDQRTMDIAQNNVDKATVEGLTRTPKVYDADMNARKAIRTNQMRLEYKGILATPDNTVGLSNQTYKTFNVIYGPTVVSPNKISKEMISNTESTLLLKHFEAFQKSIIIPEAIPDTTFHKVR